VCFYCLSLVGCAAGAEHRDRRQPTPIVETPAPPAPSVAESGTTDAGRPRQSASGSEQPCTGVPPEGFSEVMVLRAQRAQRCYDRALVEDPKLEGRFQIELRIEVNGTVASVEVIADELRSESLRHCVIEMFRQFVAPRPQGGCVDVLIPLNFRKRPDADAGADAAAPAPP
jgi:hypothetical protein